jgi:hypothetical protein
MAMCIKGASRPFGIEQVRPLTHTTTTRKRRSHPGAADKTGHNRQDHHQRLGYPCCGPGRAQPALSGRPLGLACPRTGLAPQFAWSLAVFCLTGVKLDASDNKTRQRTLFLRRLTLHGSPAGEQPASRPKISPNQPKSTQTSPGQPRSGRLSPFRAGPSPRDTINPTDTPVAPRPTAPGGRPCTHNSRIHPATPG